MKTVQAIRHKDVKISEVKPGQMFSYRNSKFIKDNCWTRCSINLTTGGVIPLTDFPEGRDTIVHLLDQIILQRR